MTRADRIAGQVLVPDVKHLALFLPLYLTQRKHSQGSVVNGRLHYSLVASSWR